MSTLKKIFSIICICVLCVTAQAQVVIGVTRTGQVGTAGQNLEFVDQFGNIVAYPSLSPTGELLDAMRPSVVTNVTVTDVTKTSATTGGKVVAPGASDVTECGVCYGTSPYPTIMDAHLTATPDANGEYTVNLTGLQPNTTYYVRAYATNAIGTSYGTSMPFTTRGNATITITGNTESKTYNGSAQSVTGYTVTIPDGINITADQITYSGNAAATGTNVGTYTLTLSADDFSCTNANYDVTFQVVAGTLTITKATATVTANDASKVYGATDPTSFTAAVNGVLGSDVLNYSVARVSGEDAGTYDINVTLGNNPNYEVTAAKGTFTITPASATVTITGSTGSQTYNAQEQSVTGYTVNAPTGISESQISYSGTAVAKGTNVGTYSMGLTQDNFTCSNPNFNVTFNVTDGALTITKATATVKADAKSKTYGDSDPALTATVTGVLGNDQLNYTLALPSNYDGRAGDWAIGVTLGDNPNYNVTPTNGLYTVNKKAATIVVDNKTKEYGDADPALTATVSGTVGSDMLNYTLSRNAGEDVGDYAITVTKGANNDYDITITNGTLTITRAAAKVTAEAKEKMYGTNDPPLTATVSGLKNGDAASVITYTVSRAAGENVGTYAITPSGAAEQGNYTVTYASANLTIVPADQITVTITGNTDTKTYNGSEQSVTGYTVSVPNGVSISTDQISYSGTAEAKGTNVGTYPMGLTQGTFTCSNPNYNVTFDVTDGSLAITKKAASVTADAKTKVYGATDPTLTATVTGVQTGETLNYTLSRVAGENAGTYDITVTLGSNPNYEVTATKGTFTITTATATVTANDASKVYGATDPTFTATVMGVQTGETLNYTLSRVAGENAGTYDITVTLGSNPNYEVTATKGTFTITKATATVTITGSTGSKTYNGREQSVTGYTVGIPSGVNIQQSEISTTATATAKGTNVGTYTMGLTAAAFSTTNGNYNVTFNVTDGSLTIARANATVTADDKTKVAGESDPQFTATVTGLQGNDQPTLLSYSFSRATGETLGTYAIKPTGDAVQGNYNVSYVNGTLTITVPPCPTLGATTHTPDPVTSSTTTITLSTPVNNMVDNVVTISDASFTIVADGVSNRTIDATYNNNNGAIIASLTDLDAYRGKPIKVTPKIVVTGCSTSGAITGNTVEICVQPVLPSFGTVSNTDATGKTNFFYRKGSYVYATINNYDADLIVEKGFYISSIQSEVQNHSCSPTTGDYGNLDISSYSPSDFRDGFSVVANPTPTATTTALNTRVDISHCNQTTYYRPYMVIRMCGDRDTTIYGTTKSLTMWKPENMTVTANPTTLTSGSAVTLTANADMTIGSYTGSTMGMSNASIIKFMFCGNVSSSLFNGIDASTGKASMDTWVQILNQCTDLRNMMGGSGTTMEWSYSWDNGATGKTRTVNAAGTYTAYGNLKLNDETCTVSKNITISTGQ